MVWTFVVQVLPAWPGLMAQCSARDRSYEQHFYFYIQYFGTLTIQVFCAAQSRYFHLATQMNLKAYFKSKHKHVKMMTVRKFPEKANVNN